MATANLSKWPQNNYQLMMNQMLNDESYEWSMRLMQKSYDE